MENYSRKDTSDTNTPSPKNSKQAIIMKFLKENSLLLLTFISVIVGFGFGFAIRTAQPSNDAIMWIGMPGEIFLRTLTAMIIPLIVSNVISGSAALDVKSNGKLGLCAIIFVLMSNLLGAIIGLSFFLLIKPGTNFEINQSNSQRTKAIMNTEDLFADLIRNIFPDDIISASFRQTLTSYKKVEAQLNMSEEFTNSSTYQRKIGSADGSNILGLITFSFLFGVAASSLKEKGEPFRMFFESTSLITAEIFKYLLKITPIGVASLIMATIASIKNINTLFTSLGMFSLTVFAGLFFHLFILQTMVYIIIFRKNPFIFLFTCIRPYILAFTFTSSSAAYAEMEYSLVQKNKADKRVVGVSLPLVVTLNAGGSAVFIVTAAMFLTSYQGVHLNAGNVSAIVLLTAITSMALPGIPSSSIVTLILLFTSMNISPKPIAMLYALEWILDRLRTGNNALSHILGCLIVDHFMKFSMTTEHKKHKGDENCEELKIMTSTVTASPEESALLEEKNSLFLNGNTTMSD